MLAPERVRRLIEGIIVREGGYVSHPDDPGGATKYGITERVARANGYRGEMRDLPVEFAREVYLTQYYRGPHFDWIAKRSPVLAEELTDTGVNMGVREAVTFLQRSLNALNRQGRDYSDIRADGYIGMHTLDALDAYLEHRDREGVTVLMRALNCLQGAEYISESQDSKRLEAFVFGWLRTRIA